MATIEADGPGRMVTFRLPQGLCVDLQALSGTTGQTQTAIVKEAVAAFCRAKLTALSPVERTIFSAIRERHVKALTRQPPEKGRP